MSFTEPEYSVSFHKSSYQDHILSSWIQSIPYFYEETIYLSIYLSVYLSICLSIYLSLCLSIYPSIYLSLSVCLWLYSPGGPWPHFQFINLYTVSRTSWTGDQPVARPLPTHRATQTQNKRTQTSMPRVGFEPTIPVFEWAKTVHALDRASTVIGIKKL
jgi:hypothetical protein